MNDTSTPLQGEQKGENQKVILVAEDEELFITVLQRVFGQEGYKVLVARNGEQALHIVQEVHPDIVLLDLIMPHVDGFEFLEKLRQDEKVKDTKVLVLSNLGQQEEIRRATDLGALDFIIKANTSIDKLVEIAKKHMGDE